MKRPTPTDPYWFPETLACFTLLAKAGYDPADLYFSAALKDPISGFVCMGVIVRPPEARGKGDAWTGKQASFALEPIDFALVADEREALGLLANDMTLWNETTQDQREARLNASEIRKRAVDVLAVASLRLGPGR